MGDSLDDSIKWVITPYDDLSVDSCSKIPEPKYSLFGERIRHVAPSSVQCSLFCGGKQCKYCNPAKFKKEPGQDAINGLYSAWVTENILATSRPSTTAIDQYKIIEQFQENDIKAIINLQHPGEHAACGFGLEDGGFSYVPQQFMDNGVFFYNFGWNDYGVRSLQSILDMVKVFDFALSNGKAAVHCHAGLGRTGVLIACYLIYSMRMSSHESILEVRKARPKAIQTRGQINCVNDFEAYIRPMWMIFSENDTLSSLKCFMKRQRSLLHGEEARTLRNLPKVVYVICQQLLTQAEVEFDLSQSAITTHFSFMINSSFCKSFEEKTVIDQTDSKDSERYLEKDDVFTDNYSDDGYLETHSAKDDEVPSLKNQQKAMSEPNVSLTNLRSEKAVLDVAGKKGRIVLEPIQSSKKKKKKKRPLQDRVKGIQNGTFAVKGHTSLNENVRKLSEDSSENNFLGVSTTSTILKEKIRNNKADSISLASFSSTSNEGLSRSDLVLKHLAFRSSDISTSIMVERYKKKLNSNETTWNSLSEEKNIGVLVGLFWGWFSQIESPILSMEEVVILKEHNDHPEEASKGLDKDVWKLMKFFVIFLSKLDGKTGFLVRVLRRFSIVLTGLDLPSDIAEDGRGSGEEPSDSVVVFKFLSSWLDMLKES